jgi:hypothetical protein
MSVLLYGSECWALRYELFDRYGRSTIVAPDLCAEPQSPTQQDAEFEP